jgi:signal transduction histidine kinase
MEKSRKRKVKVILGAIALVCLLHYLTPLRYHFYHELFSRLYYFPIFLGGFWFGLRGGILASLVVTLVYLPHLVFGWHPDRTLFYDKLLEVVLFNLAGLVIGAMADRERRQRSRIQELQTLAALGEAASSVAHEMKNMVIPIRGFLRRIREGCQVDGQAASYLEIVERESSRLEEMTRDMLAFARKASLQREEVAVGPFLEEMREEMNEIFRDKGVRLTCECEDGDMRVPMDRERVHQSLVNLLQNALHASSEGKQVRLIASRNGDSLRIAVEDEGSGIPRENLDRLFLPFFTTKPKGTGLGLAIAQGIVREHGGEIGVDSAPEKGTRVWLELPLSPGLISPVGSQAVPNNRGIG